MSSFSGPSRLLVEFLILTILSSFLEYIGVSKRAIASGGKLWRYCRMLKNETEEPQWKTKEAKAKEERNQS